jgi:integrase
MPFPKGQNPTIRLPDQRLRWSRFGIKGDHRIKKILADRPRDLCLFTLGINTAYRANELLSLKVGRCKLCERGCPGPEAAQDAQVPSR